MKFSESVPSDFQYAGYYYHAPSGLNLTLNRVYSAQVGRWINRDPIEELGGNNLYAYVLNQPTNHTDPTGLQCNNIPPSAEMPLVPNPLPPIDPFACERALERNLKLWGRPIYIPGRGTIFIFDPTLFPLPIPPGLPWKYHSFQPGHSRPPIYLPRKSSVGSRTSLSFANNSLK